MPNIPNQEYFHWCTILQPLRQESAGGLFIVWHEHLSACIKKALHGLQKTIRGRFMTKELHTVVVWKKDGVCHIYIHVYIYIYISSAPQINIVTIFYANMLISFIVHCSFWLPWKHFSNLGHLFLTWLACPISLQQ